MSATKFPTLIFAAGFGTRMKHLTRDRPKPLVEVAGKPLIEHTLALAKQADCAPIVTNLHYKAELLEAHLHPMNVQTVVERPDILDTGGGLRNALPLLGQGPVVTLNSDAIWDGPNPIQMLKEAWEPDRMDALLICVPLPHAIGHAGKGDFLLGETGRLSRGAGAVYGGVQILKTELLAKIEETAFSLNVVWDRMLEQNRLFGLQYPGRWCDVGHPAGIKQAEQMLDDSRV